MKRRGASSAETMRPSLTQSIFMSEVIVFITVSRPVAMQTAYRACAPLTEVYHMIQVTHSMSHSRVQCMLLYAVAH